MDVIKLANEIIDGRRLNKSDDLEFFKTCELDVLCMGADKIRQHFNGDKIELCSIISGKSGRCPEDCKYCAQSAYHNTGCQVYDFLPTEDFVKACQANQDAGVDRFSIVTSGRRLDDADFEKVIGIYEILGREFTIDLCASHGFLSADQFRRLREAGVCRYHHNIETSRRYFPEICTTHTYDQKLETIKLVKAAGMQVCSGGIIGMGENFDDRIDMALDLAELGVDSIPLNALMPIKGTPLEDMERISESDILRTVAIFKFINPEADVRLAAGRALISGAGEAAFKAGASASITGDMLTTAGGATVKSDKEMLERLGRI